MFGNHHSHVRQTTTAAHNRINQLQLNGRRDNKKVSQLKNELDPTRQPAVDVQEEKCHTRLVLIVRLLLLVDSELIEQFKNEDKKPESQPRQILDLLGVGQVGDQDRHEDVAEFNQSNAHLDIDADHRLLGLDRLVQ